MKTAFVNPKIVGHLKELEMVGSVEEVVLRLEAFQKKNDCYMELHVAQTEHGAFDGYYILREENAIEKAERLDEGKVHPHGWDMDKRRRYEMFLKFQEEFRDFQQRQIDLDRFN